MTSSKKPSLHDEVQLWELLEQLDLDEAEVSLDADALMALAADVDAFNATVTHDDARSERLVRAGPIPIAAADLVAGNYDAVSDQDPTLIALKNRAAAIARAQRPIEAMGLRSWVGTCIAALSLSLAGFSTVYALAPFSLDTVATGASSDSALTYQLSESSLYGTQSVWDFETIE